MIEGLFDGGAGKALLAALGTLAGIILAAITRAGYRKARDWRSKLP